MDFTDFARNADKHGFCTYEQFKKNPDKWRPHKDQLFRSVDKGAFDDNLKKSIADYRYYFEGYRCETMESVENLSREMGIKIGDVRIGAIHVEKVDNGKKRLHVHFMSAQTIEKRKTW